MSNDINYFICSICGEPMLRSVVMFDGTSVHWMCAGHQRLVIPNTYLNELIKHFIETTTIFDAYISTLTKRQIRASIDLIVDSNKMCRLVNQIFLQKYATQYIFKLLDLKRYDKVNILLSKDYIDLNMTDPDGNTLLFLVCKHKLDQLAFQILNIGIQSQSAKSQDIKSQNVNDEFQSDDTSDYDIIDTHHQCDFTIIDDVSTCATINTNDASTHAIVNDTLTFLNINHTNTHNASALHFACDREMSDVALKILSFPNINAGGVSASKNTPLILACKKKLSSVALKLLEIDLERQDINVNHVDAQNFTALMWACKNALSEVAIKLLIRPDIIVSPQALNYARQAKMAPVAFRIEQMVHEENLSQRDNGFMNYILNLFG